MPVLVAYITLGSLTTQDLMTEVTTMETLALLGTIQINMLKLATIGTMNPFTPEVRMSFGFAVVNLRKHPKGDECC